MKREKVNREEQLVIKKMKAMVRDNSDFENIAEYLNENNKLFRGKKWNVMRVKYVLKNNQN